MAKSKLSGPLRRKALCNPCKSGSRRSGKVLKKGRLAGLKSCVKKGSQKKKPAKGCGPGRSRTGKVLKSGKKACRKIGSKKAKKSGGKRRTRSDKGKKRGPRGKRAVRSNNLYDMMM